MTSLIAETHALPHVVTVGSTVTLRAKSHTWMYAESIVVMTLLFLVAVGVPTGIGFGSLEAGFALGLFCAVWGGPGFGVMAASARIALRDERCSDER